MKLKDKAAAWLALFRAHDTSVYVAISEFTANGGWAVASAG